MKNPAYLALGQRVQAKRQALKLSLEAVEIQTTHRVAVPVKPSWLKKLEAGRFRKPPDRARLEALAVVLDLDPSELLALGGHPVRGLTRVRPPSTLDLARELVARLEAEQVISLPTDADPSDEDMLARLHAAGVLVGPAQIALEHNVTSEQRHALLRLMFHSSGYPSSEQSFRH